MTTIESCIKQGQKANKLQFWCIFFYSCIGSVLGCFIGKLAFMLRCYGINPDYYITQSAPWYTELIPMAIVSAVVLAISIPSSIHFTKKYREEKDLAWEMAEQNAKEFLAAYDEKERLAREKEEV